MCHFEKRIDVESFKSVDGGEKSDNKLSWLSKALEKNQLTMTRFTARSIVSPLLPHLVSHKRIVAPERRGTKQHLVKCGGKLLCIYGVLDDADKAEDCRRSSYKLYTFSRTQPYAYDIK